MASPKARKPSLAALWKRRLSLLQEDPDFDDEDWVVTKATKRGASWQVEARGPLVHDGRPTTIAHAQGRARRTLTVAGSFTPIVRGKLDERFFFEALGALMSDLQCNPGRFSLAPLTAREVREQHELRDGRRKYWGVGQVRADAPSRAELARAIDRRDRAQAQELFERALGHPILDDAITLLFAAGGPPGFIAEVLRPIARAPQLTLTKDQWLVVASATDSSALRDVAQTRATGDAASAQSPFR